MLSSSSSVEEIEMEKMFEHRAIISGSVMKNGREKLLEHSGGANGKLVGESENGSCSSWVVDIQKMVEQADQSVEMARWKQRSIYRVPEFIKKMSKSDAYKPQFVSLGPYHHGEPHLLPMEEHKRRALVHLVKRAGKPLVEFAEKIEEVVDELQAAYDDLDDKWRGANRGSFVEMMVTDGCFLLELISMVFILVKNKIHDKCAANDSILGYYAADVDDSILSDYAADDPIFSERSISNLWSIMRMDMIVMENQLPLVVLQRLLAVQLGTSPQCRHSSTPGKGWLACWMQPAAGELRSMHLPAVGTPRRRQSSATDLHPPEPMVAVLVAGVCGRGSRQQAAEPSRCARKLGREARE